MKKFLTILAIIPFTLFADSPMKTDDPEALKKIIPALAKQVDWKTLATPEQIALFDGPETQWETVLVSEYRLDGFDPKLLGSALPEPGVHPRVLFSPEDLPRIREAFIGSKNQLTAQHVFETQLWNPEAPDYKWYSKLASGDLEGLEFEDDFTIRNGNHYFKGYPCKIHITHTPVLPRILASAAAYALFMGDEARSQELATAVANYYKLREPIVDQQNERGTMAYLEKYKRGEVTLEPWPNDLWRGMHLVSGAENVGLAYDYTANWMTKEQKKLMRRYIAKCTAGKRAYGQNGPIRWRDTNWVGWDLTLPLTALAIEGEEGFDEELLEVAQRTVDGYLTFGISPDGTIFETNGKNGAGFLYVMQTSIALARRDMTNFFGHPHLRKLSESQIQQISPNGEWSVNNGTYGCSKFGQGKWLASAYPNNALDLWMLEEGVRQPEEDLKQYAFRLNASREELKAKGLQGVGRIRPDVIFDDWLPVPTENINKEQAAWERADLGLDLDFHDPVHGQFSARSSNDKDALFMMIEARPDLYVGGHQHHDAGHFYMAANDRKWGIEAHEGRRASMFHSIVLIDGKGQGSVQHLAPSKVEWLGAEIQPQAAFAKMNTKRGYDSIWTTPMHYSWGNEEMDAYDWSPETDPEVVRIWKGTQNYKARVWMHSYWNYNWGPTMKAAYNPVEYAYRTAGLVRGEQPYLLVVDDIQKDAQVHNYEWTMQVPDDLVLCNNAEGANVVFLASKEDVLKRGKVDEPRKGASYLGVYIIHAAKEQGATQYDYSVPLVKLETIQGAIHAKRLVITSRSVRPDFKVLLLSGTWDTMQTAPQLKVEGATAQLSTFKYDPEQRKSVPAMTDLIEFERGDDPRTRLRIIREGQQIIEVK